MVTVHLILHAHLDPIWLWPWQSGLDEALATCRSACDRLDRNPDACFTQGEAWVHREIEGHDPELFSRVAAHVAAGRWEIAGDWWIQPDCEAPSGLGLERQIACGKAYFRERFGRFLEVAFNPDSFGHAATLPGIMAAAGQRFYAMMRPQEHETPLPARLFRWRGELALAQAEGALRLDPRPPSGAAEALEEHWRAVAFMQFHDTLGGTCLPSAYRQAEAYADFTRGMPAHV